MKKILSILLALVTVFSLAACGNTTGSTASSQPSATTGGTTSSEPSASADAASDMYTKEDPLVIRYNTNVKSADAADGVAQRTFKEKVEELSGGKVTVEYYWNQTLANNTEAVVGGLQTGSFEMADIGVGALAEYSKAFLPLDVPYLIADKDVAYEVLKGEVGQIMIDKLAEDTGILALKLTDLGFRHITNTAKPITSPADLSGLKIRTQNNPLHMIGFEALGAIPSPIAFSELFTALQQKVVDGQENPITNIYNFKIYEVQTYLSLTGHLYSAGAFLVSQEFFNGLPADIQKNITDALTAAQDAGIKMIQDNEAAWLKEISAVMTVNELTAEQIAEFQKASMASWDEMAEKIGADYFKVIEEKILAIG